MRSTAEERMDTDCIDFDDYQRCLRDLARVNTVTLTHRPTLAWLAREMAGHEILLAARRRLRPWRRAAAHRSLGRSGTASRHGSKASTSIRGATRRHARRHRIRARITYHTGNVFAFEPADGGFDFIISSQFTHHLTDGQIVMFIRWMEAHARRGWFIGDLHRHWFPYYGFGLLAWLARWHHFVLSDGRISIARSFVPDDWRRLIRAAGLTEADVAITWHLPFRLCVARHCPNR